MQVFLRAQNYEIWKVVEVGPYENQGEEETWTREQIRKATLNYSVMNMIQCAVHPKEYSRISMCKSAKEMWDKLELLYEGTSQVKETKTNILVSEYELFMMKPNENISEMFARFMVIVNGLKALGKEYTDADLVRKILRSLSSICHTKATVIEDSKDLSKISLDELIGSLMTYEINLKRNEEHIIKTKPMALKASSSNKDKNQDKTSSEESESNEDEIALMTRQFRKFLKYRKGKMTGKKKFSPGKKNISSSNFNKNHKPDENVICYRCNKPGHMKGECPENKKEKHKRFQKYKKPKAMVATWSDEDTSEEEEEKKSSSSESEEVCFMANSTDGKVNTSFEDYSVEDWQDVYAELVERYSEMRKENKHIKKKIENLYHNQSSNNRTCELENEIT